MIKNENIKFTALTITHRQTASNSKYTIDEIAKWKNISQTSLASLLIKMLWTQLKLR